MRVKAKKYFGGEKALFRRYSYRVPLIVGQDILGNVVSSGLKNDEMYAGANSRYGG